MLEQYWKTDTITLELQLKVKVNDKETELDDVQKHELLVFVKNLLDRLKPKEIGDSIRVMHGTRDGTKQHLVGGKPELPVGGKLLMEV